ncbi:metal ABC transporter permease [Leucobacter sp. HNU]|uniref:metal ABC transporter permease n=1 Tax=Leucobacter sp. HNU TaxID=3236805 RepID=UPI003A80F1F4
MSYFALAAIELALLGVLSGIVGTLIVMRRRSFFAVSLSHATFPGGVLFAVLGWNLILGQALFALLLVGIMTLLARVPGQGRQVASGIVLSFGFALGTLLASLNAGNGVPVEALLVGSPLSVTGADLVRTGAVLAATLLLLAVFGRRILFHTFDPVGFAAAGFRAWPVEAIASGIIAAGVVAAMPAVGAILGVALLVGPAAAARILAPGSPGSPVSPRGSASSLASSGCGSRASSGSPRAVRSASWSPSCSCSPPLPVGCATGSGSARRARPSARSRRASARS